MTLLQVPNQKLIHLSSFLFFSFVVTCVEIICVSFSSMSVVHVSISDDSKQWGLVCVCVHTRVSYRSRPLPLPLQSIRILRGNHTPSLPHLTQIHPSHFHQHPSNLLTTNVKHDTVSSYISHPAANYNIKMLTVPILYPIPYSTLSAHSKFPCWVSWVTVCLYGFGPQLALALVSDVHLA